jgi:hypothetical protein
MTQDPKRLGRDEAREILEELARTALRARRSLRSACC